MTVAATVPSSSARERLIRRWGIRLPDEPLARRVHDTAVFMHVVGVLLMLLQGIVVAATEGWASTPLRIRIGANFGVALIMLGSLVVHVWRGRTRAAAFTSAAGLLLWLGAFAYAFGLRGSPTPFAIAFITIAVLTTVSRPRELMLWGLVFSAVIGYALIMPPRWPFAPAPLAVLTSVLLTFGAYVFFLTELSAAVRLSVDAFRAQADDVARINVSLRESIRERDALATQLETAHRLEAMGRMAGTIAHDFNNQLTVIRGYADIVATDLADGSSSERDVQQLMRAVERASLVTRDVLDFAAPRAIGSVLVDMVIVLQELLPNLEQLIAAPTRLRIEVPDAPCLVMADSAQLERLLLNLVINARDVTPVGGTIAIVLRRADRRILCSVVDGGPGVPPELRDRIFEPFFTTKGTTGGTGLGLASSHSIARQHGGTLQVHDATDATSSGSGAVFTLDLPAASADAPASAGISPTDARATRTPRLDGIATLLVEDDAALAKLAMRVLQRAGTTVTAFDNSAQAIEYLTRNGNDAARVQLVVTDLRLPGGSGADVIATARALSSRIAIVAMSGFLDDRSVAEAAQRHELSFLPKPFSARELLVAIDAARRMAHHDVESS